MKDADKYLISRVTDPSFQGWRVNGEILRRCGRLPVFARYVLSFGGMPKVRWYTVNARQTAMPREDAYMRLSRCGAFPEIHMMDPDGYNRAMSDIESYIIEIDHQARQEKNHDAA